MCGLADQIGEVSSDLPPEERLRLGYPLRPTHWLTHEALAALAPRFAKTHSDIGRPSIPPEQLLRALLLQSLYSMRS